MKNNSTEKEESKSIRDQQAIQKAVQKNLVECSREIYELKKTGLLKQGKIREISKKYAEDNITLVESYTIISALAAVGVNPPDSSRTKA